MHLKQTAAQRMLKLAAVTGLVIFAAWGNAWAGKPDTTSSNSSSLKKQLAVLLAVEREGKGNVAATESWQQVAAADASALPQVLAAIDNAGPLAANWIAAAAETIVDQTRATQDNLPVSELKRFILETEHAPRARRLAFEWLKSADESTAAAMRADFLHDPSPELRREAVAQLLNEAAAKKAATAEDEVLRLVYREALSGACDLDQVKTIKDALLQLGEKVELAQHFGFITSWQAIGPFDNRGEKAFDVAYPPEEKIDLEATCEGKPRDGETRTLTWKPATTQDEFGIVDLNKALGQENGVVGYAWTEFWSDRQRPAELRLGRDNAAKVWLNGQLIHEHRVYHSGMDMDQYIGRGTLNEGRNSILVKVLQNEQKEDWAQGWGFQLRVCDSAGQAIHSTGDTRQGSQINEN
jgi:hypothetical protein